MINRIILQCCALLVIAIGVSAQTSEYSAPINWQMYSDVDNGFSVSFPKLPMHRFAADLCKRLETNSYFAYAADAVYRVQVLQRGKEKPPHWCSSKSEFESKEFFADLIEERNLTADTSIAGLPRVSFTDKRFTVTNTNLSTWVFHDLTNRRIIELSIFSRSSSESKERVFVDSLSPAVKPNSLEIGSGAKQILGDPIAVANTSSGQTSDSPTATGPYQTVFQPPARYTDEARNRNTEGAVRLKITLLASGTVGNITVVNELPNGLTDQAIKAARSIVFIPKKVNGVNVTVVVTREYTFSIY